MVLTAAVWGHQWEGSLVMCHSDNTAVVSQVNSLHSQDPVASNMLRCLAYFQAHFDFRLRAVHIPGVRNIGADDLSCNRAAAFPFPHPGQPGVTSSPVPGASRLDLSELEGKVREFLEAGLAQSTKQVYRAGWKWYIAFAGLVAIPAMPNTSESVTLFAAFLGAEGLAVMSISSL